MDKITQTVGRAALGVVWILDTKKLFVVWTSLYLLIHSFHLFQLEIGWGWGREGFGMCFIPPSPACLGRSVRREWLLFKTSVFWRLFFALRLFSVLQILMSETSSELSLVLENLPNPWQQGMLFFPPPLASPVVFLAKFLHLI